jgi:Putative polyhydroxyalkanoic acid system protein (PHA_gran_rgn)
MSKPLLVSLPHRLGKEEAKRRLQAGFGSAQSNFGNFFTVQNETWTGDQLSFRLSALGQAAAGTVDVAEDHVKIEVTLPWLLAKFGEKAQAMIQKQGTLMLEKK